MALLPETAFLVGGSVRDALLGRQADYLDLDFVLPERAVQTAHQIARHYGAGFVVLDVEHQIARVVFDNATVDFAQQIGPTIHHDLHRRDFTINAIAYDPHTETLRDPLGGYRDLQHRVLRMIAPENLKDDPLRLLRAYRQAAQLGFSLEPATRTTIQQLAHLLSAMAAERVRGELDCLLSLPEGTTLLALAWQDGLLQPWLPAITQTQLKTVEAIDLAMAQCHDQWPNYVPLLNGWIKEKTTPGLHRSWLKATKLSQLLGPDILQAEATLSYLKYSRAEQQGVISILKGWFYLQAGLDLGLSCQQQYTLFKVSGSGFVGVALLGLARGLATDLIQELMQRYLDPEDPVAHPHPLLSGRDLIRDLQLRPGPQIGELLEAIQLAQAQGQVSNRDQALAWANVWISSRPRC